MFLGRSNSLFYFLCAYYAFPVVSSSVTGISVWRVLVSTGSPKNNHFTEVELFRLVIGPVSRFYRVYTKKIIRSIFTMELMTPPLANKLPWLQLLNPLTFLVFTVTFQSTKQAISLQFAEDS